MNLMSQRLLLLGCLLVSGYLWADEVVVGKSEAGIVLAPGKPFLHVISQGKSIKVERVQDPDFELRGYYAKTARKCPPFCIQPMQSQPGVKTIAEVELFDFMEGELRDEKGILIDARTPSWYAKGTIPGSVNYPFTILDKGADDPETEEAFEAFGAELRGDVGWFTRKLESWGFLDGELKTDKWDFTKAKDLVLFCNGMLCGQSPRAIKGLVKNGYPAEKIFYYRGGMQMWEVLGLTRVIPEQ